MKLGELFIELFLKGAGESGLQVKDLISKMKELDVSSLGGAISLKQVASEIYHVSQEAFKAAGELELFSDMTGLSTRELQGWRRAAVGAGLGADIVNSSVIALQKNLAELHLGGGNARPFLLLGIDRNERDPFRVLEQMRKNIVGMNRPMVASLIAQAGVNPQMLKLLVMTNQEMEHLKHAAHDTTERQIESFVKGERAMGHLKVTLDELHTSIADAFGPGVTMLIEGAANALHFLAENLRALMFMGGALVAAVLFPIQFLVSGILLAFEDLEKYLEGKKSLTGMATAGVKAMVDKAMKSNDPRRMAAAAAALTVMSPLAGFGVASSAMQGITGLTQNIVNNYTISGTNAESIADKVAKKGEESQKAANRKATLLTGNQDKQ